MPGHDKHNARTPLDSIYWRDEILQLMYWMLGEGFGREFDAPELQKFLQMEDAVLVDNLEHMVSAGLVERAGENKHALTSLGEKEGGRRFADEFEGMLKPGHFECAEPDCDCHNPESTGEACKHLSPAHSMHQHP